MAIYAPGPRTAFPTASRPGNDKSFLRRLFNRNKPRPSSAATTTVVLPTSRSTYDLSHGYRRDEGRIFALPPSPHTHPLLSKPYARDELRPRSSMLNQARIDGSNARKGTASSARPAGGRSVVDGGGGGTRGDAKTTVQGQYVQEWGFFIKCYAEGRFNVSNPPDPPPGRRDFGHFAAPVPPNEGERLEAVKSCNVSLSPEANEKFYRFILLAKRLFHTRMAAISLVDGDAEVFKAEHAFGRRIVDRSESIGAHVLLSNEPMVVLDATKDWRLRGNPLVRGAPHVRFYAGAPIVTFDGRTIGTFSVFDDAPRAAFSVAERRKLMNFARHSMTEIENAMEERDILSRRTTPVTDLGTLRDQVQQSGTLTRPRTATDGVPSSPRSPPPLIPRIPRTVKNRDTPTPVATRPSSIRPGMRPPAISIPMADPEDGGTRSGTIPNHKNSTSSTSSARISDMPTPPHTPSRPSSTSTDGSRGASASEEARQSRYCQRKPPQLQIQPLTTPPAPRELPLQLPATPRPATSLAESSFAMSIIARSLNYDLVYLLRVSPITIAPPRFSTRVLVSHGLPTPLPVFDANLHLRALRSAGGLVYRNPARCREEDDVGFRLGILLPLLRDGSGPDDATCCTGGIVLAAFTRKVEHECGGGGGGGGGEEDDGQGGQPFTADEVRCLREFGEAMKDILVRVDCKF